MIWLTILLTAVAFTVATWVLDRWGPWDRPRWWLPLTLTLALALVWSGIVIGVRIGRAEYVVERAELTQLRTFLELQLLDSALMDFVGLPASDRAVYLEDVIDTTVANGR